MPFDSIQGCYLGQEVLSRLAKVPKPKRLLLGIRFDGATPPAVRYVSRLAGDNTGGEGATLGSIRAGENTGGEGATLGSGSDAGDEADTGGEAAVGGEKDTGGEEGRKDTGGEEGAGGETDTEGVPCGAVIPQGADVFLLAPPDGGSGATGVNAGGSDAGGANAGGSGTAGVSAGGSGTTGVNAGGSGAAGVNAGTSGTAGVNAEGSSADETAEIVTADRRPVGVLTSLLAVGPTRNSPASYFGLALLQVVISADCVASRVKRSTGHTHTPTENTTPDTDTHAHDKNNTPNPQTNTSHKHLTTLKGGATTVRATSHARVGGRADVSVCRV